MTADEAGGQAPKTVAKKALPPEDPPRDDRSYLKPGEEHLPETTQAEIIMGRKTLEANNPKALMVERLNAEEDARQPRNILLQRGDPRATQASLKTPPVN